MPIILRICITKSLTFSMIDDIIIIYHTKIKRFWHDKLSFGYNHIKRGVIMPYELKKLFHFDRSKYEEEYAKRFNSDETVHFDFKIGGKQAFVCQNSEILKLIISIERTNTKIACARNKLPKIAILEFARRCLIDEIILSNNIEGVHSTQKEISAILSDLSEKNKRKRFYGLVKKYEKLMTADKISLETCEDIRKIYDELFLEEVKEYDPQNVPDGKIFRKSSVSVYSPTQKEIHQGLNPEEKIIEVMTVALSLLKNEKLDILVRISLFHYLFGYIHPFYDGNGRTSRFISSYLLSKELNNLVGYRISYTIKENLSKYYKAFEVCNHPLNKGELTLFVEMFLNIIDMSQNQLLSALEERAEHLSKYLEILDKMFGKEESRMKTFYFILVQAALFSNIGISAKELAKIVDVSENTMRSMLKRMPQNMLIINKSEKPYHYLMNLDELDKCCG